MSEYSVSSIPVVDQNDHLIGNISMADVRVWVVCDSCLLTSWCSVYLAA